MIYRALMGIRVYMLGCLFIFLVLALLPSPSPIGLGAMLFVLVVIANRTFYTITLSPGKIRIKTLFSDREFDNTELEKFSVTGFGPGQQLRIRFFRKSKYALLLPARFKFLKEHLEEIITENRKLAVSSANGRTK